MVLKLLYNRIKTDINKSSLSTVDLDLQKLLMATKYPHADYQFLIRLKCTVKKLIERHYKLTKQGKQKLISDIQHAIALSKKVQTQK